MDPSTPDPPSKPPSSRPAPTEAAAGAPAAGSGAAEKAQESVNAAGAAEYGPDVMQSEAARLMSAAQEGDRAAFNDLVQRLRGRAFLVAKTLVGSRDDALDMCQEAFLKVFRARESYNPQQPFLPWFHRILRNTCFSHLRRRGRVGQHSLTMVGPDGEESDWEIVDPAPAPDAGILADERAAMFQQAMSRLSARDREILALRHFKELSYSQIARSLGIPEGTVMSRLFHARRRLRDVLGPLLAEPPQPTRQTARGESGADRQARRSPSPSESQKGR